VKGCILLVVLCEYINPLKSIDTYRDRTAPLTSKRFILYIYSTNIGTEYTKHVIYSPFVPLQNAVCFTILTYLFPVLFTFYIRDLLKLKKIPAPKGQNAVRFVILTYLVPVLFTFYIFIQQI